MATALKESADVIVLEAQSLPTKPTGAAEIGINVTGLCVHGAYYDTHKNSIIESRPFEAIGNIAWLHLHPLRNHEHGDKPGSAHLFALPVQDDPHMALYFSSAQPSDTWTTRNALVGIKD